MPGEELAKFKDIFISEAQDYLQALNQGLLALEKKPDDHEPLNAMFRSAHTLKSMAGTMGFEKIVQLAQAMETLLDKLSKGQLAVTNGIIDVLFSCFDNLGILLEDITVGRDSGLDIAVPLELITGQAKSSVADKPERTEDKVINQDSKLEIKRRNTRVKVNIEQLDNLMNLVSELVINKARIIELVSRENSPQTDEILRQFDRITLNLQEEVLKTRMIPISHIFDRYSRMVRDLARNEGKEINFVVSGSEIEVDRVLLEEINDPLVHLLRNAVDHGIELPEQRVKSGKPPLGLIKLEARRERGYVHIEVSDDGKGLDRDKICQKAMEESLITEEQSSHLSQKQILELICFPGFTTSNKVTDVSGRGVGMDVVKTKMEAFGGRLEVYSRNNQGATFSLELPLTLAIIQALIVKVREETYALPLINVSEIVGINEEDIKTIGGKEVIKLRNQILPLIKIAEAFQLDKKELKAGSRKTVNVVVVETVGQKVGLVIDTLIGRKEIVIKTLPSFLRGVKGVSGVTILGDGRVVPIVDVTALV